MLRNAVEDESRKKRGDKKKIKIKIYTRTTVAAVIL